MCCRRSVPRPGPARYATAMVDTISQINLLAALGLIDETNGEEGRPSGGAHAGCTDGALWIGAESKFIFKLGSQAVYQNLLKFNFGATGEQLYLNRAAGRR